MAKKRITELTGTNVVENDDWLAIDSPTEGTRKIKPTDVADVQKANRNFAENYNTAVSYVIGDLVMHEDRLYECTGATTGTWDSTKWTATTVDNLFSNISSSADHITYDNTSSGLTADDVQEAIDEVYTKVGSAALTTTASNLSGAVNELDLDKTEVVSLNSYADWVALPASKLTDHKLYRIPGGTPAETALWDKVGTDPLDTTADDLSGAVNELNASLDKFKIIKAKTPNVTGTSTLIYSDTTLRGNYIIFSYSVITNTDDPTVWFYDNVVNNISIKTAGINMKISEASIKNCDVYIFLYKIS